MCAPHGPHIPVSRGFSKNGGVSNVRSIGDPGAKTVLRLPKGDSNKNWKSWERRGENLDYPDNQAFPCLIIKSFDNQTRCLFGMDCLFYYPLVKHSAVHSSRSERI